jgi:hypothetical protein
MCCRTRKRRPSSIDMVAIPPIVFFGLSDSKRRHQQGHLRALHTSHALHRRQKHDLPSTNKKPTKILQTQEVPRSLLTQPTPLTVVGNNQQLRRLRALHPPPLLTQPTRLTVVGNNQTTEQVLVGLQREQLEGMVEQVEMEDAQEILRQRRA